DHVRPEQRAVLAHAPTLVFEPPRLRGATQRVFRPLLRNRFGRIKSREVFTDDLLGAIAFDISSAGIPADDIAFGIKHENGVVLDRLDQQAEPLWRVLSRFPALPALGEIARSLGEPANFH